MIENDAELLSSIVQFLQDATFAMGVCDESDRLRIGVAFQEALTNASYHGNFELSSLLREEDHRTYYELAKLRAAMPAWSDRRIYVTGRFTIDEAEFTIRDDGPGFDPDCLLDPHRPGESGASLWAWAVALHSFMDEVRHNSTGNEVTLIKRRKRLADEVITGDQSTTQIPRPVA